MFEARQSKDPSSRFQFLNTEISTLSSVVSGTVGMLSLTIDGLLVTRCQVAEDHCGMVNNENQHRFLIFGAPYIRFVQNLQDLLKRQVCCYVCLMRHSRHSPLYSHNFVQSLASFVLSCLFV